MQRRDRYPNDTARGACLVTGDYDTSEGIIDLDLFLDDLPPVGRLCLSPKAVRMMVVELGLTWPSDDLRTANYELGAENRRLREENTEMRRAVALLLDAGKMAKLAGNSWAEELVAKP